MYDWMDGSKLRSPCVLPPQCLCHDGSIRRELLHPAPRHLRRSRTIEDAVDLSERGSESRGSEGAGKDQYLYEILKGMS